MKQQLYRYIRNNKIWLYMLKYSLYSLIISAIITTIDNSDIIIPNYIGISKSLSVTILVSMAASLFTMTTFTFSTIMVVLTMYSSQFSPRVVENFIKEHSSIKVLGIFLGGFVYNILTLYFIKSIPDSKIILGATISIVYVFICLFYFIFFIFSVSSNIQANRLINRLYDDANKIIDSILALTKENNTIQEKPSIKSTYKHEIKSIDFGYLNLVYLERLKAYCAKNSVSINVTERIGEYINKGDVLIEVFSESEEIDEEELIKSIEITKRKSIELDVRYSLQKITEIALRAVSPSTNDPNTAIHCIRLLGILFSKISSYEDEFIIFSDNDNVLIYKEFNFKKDLYFSFYQLIHYAKEDLSVILSIYDALLTIKENASQKNVQSIERFAKYVHQKTSMHFENEVDMYYYNKAYTIIVKE